MWRHHRIQLPIFYPFPGTEVCRLSGDDNISAGPAAVESQKGANYYQKAPCIDRKWKQILNFSLQIACGASAISFASWKVLINVNENQCSPLNKKWFFLKIYEFLNLANYTGWLFNFAPIFIDTLIQPCTVWNWPLYLTLYIFGTYSHWST